MNIPNVEYSQKQPSATTIFIELQLLINATYLSTNFNTLDQVVLSRTVTSALFSDIKGVCTCSEATDEATSPM